jgi:DNA-binding response OmpR family regulator
MRQDGLKARKRVMIISHGRRIGLEVADWLASDGYEVAIGRADEAAEQLSTVRPDRIVLDRHLPISDGLEALRLIRLRCPQVPVFTVTENARHIRSYLKPDAGDASLFLTPLQNQ